jgi:hypothetical protein
MGRGQWEDTLSSADQAQPDGVVEISGERRVWNQHQESRAREQQVGRSGCRDSPNCGENDGMQIQSCLFTPIVQLKFGPLKCLLNIFEHLI